MEMIANKKILITLGSISLDFGHEKFGIIILSLLQVYFVIYFLYSGFGLSIVAGLLYSFCFTFMQLMELCTDDEHQNVKGRRLHCHYFKNCIDI